MRRALAIAAAVTAFGAFSLNAEVKHFPEPYVVHQGGAWPRSWPKELDQFRGLSREGLRSWTFQRPGEPLVHYGMKFLTREEFEGAWPYLLEVKSPGAPIILRSGLSQWLGGASHGVCIHMPPVGKRLLTAQELQKAPWKTRSYLELIVDGAIVDLDRISLPEDTPIIDRRVKGSVGRDDGAAAPQPIASGKGDDTTGKPAGRKLRDFGSEDPLLSHYEYLFVAVEDPAKSETVEKELARYGRIVKDDFYTRGGLAAYVYDDVDTDAARAALEKVDGAGETRTGKRYRYDKRIPDLHATLRVGRATYAIDNSDDLDVTFFLTNVSKREPREFRSIDSNLCQLALTLEGPGAHSGQIVKTRESTIVLRGNVIRLEPGESYRLHISSLTFGDEYSLQKWKWTEPGEYTLTAAYQIGEVRYEAPPVTLTVVGK